MLHHPCQSIDAIHPKSQQGPVRALSTQIEKAFKTKLPLCNTTRALCQQTYHILNKVEQSDTKCFFLHTPEPTSQTQMVK
jgi:Tat protein secretion system quality control protein TatD with DNase activity